MHSECGSVMLELKRFLGEGILIEALQGGAINRSFCVSQGDERYFLKLFDDSTALKLDRQLLFEQQQRLAKAGLAPLPIYLSVDKDFQLEQWITATNLEQSTLTRAEKCQVLAHTLSHIHGIELPLAKLDLAHDWCYYITLSQQKLSAVEQQKLTDMLSYWQQESSHLSVLCHNDLAFAHVTEAPSTLVFDWEYSALSNPFFDIASCITINQLDNAEQDTLLMTYATERQLDMAYVVHKVGLMLPIVAKTNALWSLAFVH